MRYLLTESLTLDGRPVGGKAVPIGGRRRRRSVSVDELAAFLEDRAGDEVPGDDDNDDGAETCACCGRPLRSDDDDTDEVSESFRPPRRAGDIAAYLLN